MRFHVDALLRSTPTLEKLSPYIWKIKKVFSSSLLTIWVENLRRYRLINALSKSSYKRRRYNREFHPSLTSLCVSTYHLTIVSQIFMKPLKTAFLCSVNLTNLLFTQSIPQDTTTLRSSDHKLNLHVLGYKLLNLSASVVTVFADRVVCLHV